MAIKNTIKKPKRINLTKFEDSRGNLSFIEANKHIPFSIKRTYLIYDVPGGEIRGGHAYKQLEEFIIALSGSFDIVLNNGKKNSKITLNRSYYGVYVPSLVWRKLENFSTNSLCMILASRPYEEEDYIRSHDKFLEIKNEK